jgi:chromate reductase, NAD(P)H dehydrogenase (quinone)
MNSTIKAIGISGSLRSASTNTGLLRSAQANLPEGMALEILDINAVPFYNADYDIEGRPAIIAPLIEKIANADALVFACPEYNYSIAPALKNIIDWASREPENHALNGKPVAIMGSGGGMGTSRAQYHLRQVCVYLNLLPLNKPEVFVNAFAGGFDDQGNIVDEKLKNQVSSQMLALKDWAKKLRTPM